jgi:hypothetical protein
VPLGGKQASDLLLLKKCLRLQTARQCVGFLERLATSLLLVRLLETESRCPRVCAHQTAGQSRGSPYPGHNLTHTRAHTHTHTHTHTHSLFSPLQKD